MWWLVFPFFSPSHRRSLPVDLHNVLLKMLFLNEWYLKYSLRHLVLKVKLQWKLQYEHRGAFSNKAVNIHASISSTDNYNVRVDILSCLCSFLTLYKVFFWFFAFLGLLYERDSFHSKIFKSNYLHSAQNADRLWLGNDLFLLWSAYNFLIYQLKWRFLSFALIVN